MDLSSAFLLLLSPVPFGFIFLGVFVGIVVGAIPGLSGAMVIALTLPLTFLMDSSNALSLLVSMYVGSTSGGLISATLMRMPGTPAAMMTVLDGFPMAARGEPGRALGFGIIASFVGGMISWIFLALLSPPLAEIAVRFGPYEIFSITLVALMLISAVSQGSMLKGLISGLLGVAAAMVGPDEASGVLRLTFGYESMDAGMRLLPVLLGVLVLSQVIDELISIDAPVERIPARVRDMFMKLSDLRKQAVNLIRSSLIGTWIGILPGVGGTTAAIASYAVARNFSKRSHEFGTGCEDGIVAAETANNAAVNGALVPLITMGIPGSVVDVILLGALVIHNLTPGPLLFTNSPESAYGIIAAALIANVLMLIIMMLATPWLARLMYVPKQWILPPIIVFCLIGAYSISNRMVDVWIMFAFALVGFLMLRIRMPSGPFIVGFVLAPIAEVTLRSGLMIYDGSYWPLITRPASALFLVFAVLTAFWPLLSSMPGRSAAARKPAPKA